MSVKKHIIMGMATGLLGVALISGGTVAYFSDSVETKTNIISGILELDISDKDDLLLEFTNQQPGDVFNNSFTLTNTGTLDMKNIILYSEHKIYDRYGDEVSNGFDKQIIIKQIEVNNESILDEAISIEALKKEPITLAESIKTDDPNVQVFVEFEFIRTKKDQNEYQGNTLELHWTFEAMQED